MKTFYWTIALISLFSVQNATEATAMPSAAVVAAEARVVIETVKAGIKTTDEALSLYDRVIDRVVPWKEFNETLVELDSYRKDYSTESAALIGDIKTFMLNGIDAYAAASQNVYEWAGLVIPLLKVYLELFNGYNPAKATIQKQILLKVLDEGIVKMNAAQAELGRSSASFNSAAGSLTTLRSRFEFEFDKESEYVQTKIFQIRIGAYAGGAWWGIPGIVIAAGIVEGKLVPELKEKMESIKTFYGKLKDKVEKAFNDIDETKKMLKTEIQHIGDLKVQTEETKTFVGINDVEVFHDTITQSIQDLTTKCYEYRKRHIKRTDMM